MAEEKIIGFRIVGIGSDAQDYVKRVRDEVKRLKQDAKTLGPILNLPDGKELDLTKASLAQLRKAARDLAQSGDDVDQRLVTRIAELKQRQDDANASIKETTKLLKESSLAPGSYRALQAELARLRNSYKELGREAREGFPGKELRKRIQALDSELKDLDAGIGQFQRNVGNYGAAFDRLGSILQGAGIAVGLQEIVDLNSRLSDSLGSVQKSTDLTTQELNDLRAALEARDTRTSIFDQLEIVRIGGQLGVAKDQLLDFTESIDKAAVALGDDLGGGVEEISRDLGQLQALLVNDEDGVGKGIERLGSSINELGKQGPNTGAFIVDFTKRLAATGDVAGVTAPQLFGLGAALQEAGLTSEVASTALNDFFVRIAANEEQFSSFAEKVGVTRDQFADLVRNSPNEALLAVLEGAKATEGGLAGLNELLENLGVSGSGSARTLAALSNNIDLVRERQEIANSAFSEATSLTNEFDIQNQTFAANLEKLKNQFIALVTESGILEFLTNASKGLLQFTKFVQENATALGIAGAALVALNPKLAANLLLNNKLAKAIKSNTLLQAGLNTARSVGGTIMAVLTGKVKLATVAQRALNVVMRANPIGLVVAAVGLLIAGFVKLYSESETVRATLAGTFAAAKQVITNFVDSVKGRLTGFGNLIAGAFTLDLDRVKEGLSQLRESFVSGTVGLADGVGEAYNQAYAAKLKDGGEQAADALNDGLASRLDEVTDKTADDAGSRIAKRTIASLQDELSRAKDNLQQIELGTPEFAAQQQLVNDLQAQLDAALGRGSSSKLKAEVAPPQFTGTGFEFNLDAPDERAEGPIPDVIDVEGTKEKMAERLEALDEALDREVLALRQAQFDGLKTEEEVEEARLRLRAEYLRKKADLVEGSVADDVSIQSAALDAEFALFEFYEERRTSKFAEEAEKRTAKEAEEAAKRADLRQRAFEKGLKVVEQGAAVIAKIQENRVNQEEQQELESLEDRYQKRIEAAEGNEEQQARLEREFEAKKQRIQEEAAEKRRQIAKKETIINAAVAAVKTFANLGFPAAIPAIAGLAIITGLQLKAIEEQQFAEGGDLDAANGSISPSGKVYGPSHSQGGVKVSYRGRGIELEGGEQVVRNGSEAYVINKRSARAFRPQLARLTAKSSQYSPERRALASAINSANGWGVPFASGGPLDAPQVSVPAPPQPGPGFDVSVIEDLKDGIDAALNLATEVNGRIDRIQVAVKPKDIVEQGTKEIKRAQTFGR